MNDCHNWRNCEGVCEDCEMTNMDPAQAFRKWTPEMLEHIGPEETLVHLQALARRALSAEQERDHIRIELEAEKEQNDKYRELLADISNQATEPWSARKALQGLDDNA